MNKTVNINLVGTSFHIDEDAYGKLSRYLTAIRKSLNGTEGSEEIMRDIEARIAELFLEKVDNQAQVITLRDLDEVIAIMGQPEDYGVEENVFEDTAGSYSQTGTPKSNRHLFRDIDDKFISGVSSGIGHYLGIQAIWIRLLWILLILAGMGSPILIYILLWILMPAAMTTSDKLKMKGEPVNISNIEKKFKEGFDNVADKVKNADYNKVKDSTSSFFDALGKLIVVLFNVFVKLIGILIIFISLSTLVTILISFITLGSINIWGNNQVTDYIAMVDTTDIPLWLSATMVFLAVAIPFFALFILGLKLMIKSLKPIGNTAKILLVVLWVISIIGLIIVGIKQATQQGYDGSFVTEETIPFSRTDTLYLSMNADYQYDSEVSRRGNLSIKYNKDNHRIIYSNNITLDIQASKDSIVKILIDKKAEGNSHLDAKNRAQAIDYKYVIEQNKVSLDGFFTSEIRNKFRNQKLQITIFLPESMVINPDRSTNSYFSYNSNAKDVIEKDGQFFKISKNGLVCLDCVLQVNDSIPQAQKMDSLAPSWEEEVEKEFENF